MGDVDAGEHLFDYFAIVKLPAGGPVVDMVYPEAREMDAKGISQFCWPEGQLVLETESRTKTENYSFVLTESSGEKRYGYCRRFLRSDPPECFVVVSSLASPGFFAEMLNIVELRRTLSEEASLAFIGSAWEVPVPDAGESAIIWTSSLIGRPDPDTYTLERPAHHELLLDHVSFHTLFSLVSLKNILLFFSSMVLERRLILVAENLATLSSCVTAAQSLMQPFHWQHVYIPVLPNSLLDYCTAPMPFFVGVLKSSLPALNTMPLEEVLILDVDEDEFLLDPGLPDLIPGPERAVLLEHLRSLKITPDRECNIQIASCFYQFFHSIFRTYGDYYNPQTNRFDLETYMMVQTPQVRKFLQEFETAQIFQGFLQENEDPSKRYVFANPSDYITALSVTASRREDRVDRLQDQLSNMGKKMATTWGGVRDAISQKREARKGVLGTLRLKRSGVIEKPTPRASGEDATSPRPVVSSHRMCQACHVYTESSIPECQTCGAVGAPPVPAPEASPERTVSPRPPLPPRTPRNDVPSPGAHNKPVPKPPVRKKKKPPPVPPPPPKRDSQAPPTTPNSPPPPVGSSPPPLPSSAPPGNLPPDLPPTRRPAKPPLPSSLPPPSAIVAPKTPPKPKLTLSNGLTRGSRRGHVKGKGKGKAKGKGKSNGQAQLKFKVKRKLKRKSQGKWVKKTKSSHTNTVPPARPVRPPNHLVMAAFAHSPVSSPQAGRVKPQRKCGVCGDLNPGNATECDGCGCDLVAAAASSAASLQLTFTCARCNVFQERVEDSNECRFCHAPCL